MVGSGIWSMTAGQTIKIKVRVDNSSGDSAIDTNFPSSISIKRLSGPAVVATSETVSAKYKWGSTQSLSGSNAYTALAPDTKVWDTHNAVTTGASWKFTAPISGTYSVKVMYYFGAGETWASVDNTMNIGYQINGGTKPLILVQCPPKASSATWWSQFASVDVRLLAGDYLMLYTQNTDGSTAHTVSAQEGISITRTGNY